MVSRKDPQLTNKLFKEKGLFLKKHNPFDSDVGTTTFLTHDKQLYMFLRLGIFLFFSSYAI